MHHRTMASSGTTSAVPAAIHDIGARTTPATTNTNWMWAWIAGIVAVILVIGGVYAFSDRHGPSTASNGGAASTAQAPAAAGGGGGDARTPARTTPGTR